MCALVGEAKASMSEAEPEATGEHTEGPSGGRSVTRRDTNARVKPFMGRTTSLMMS